MKPVWQILMNEEGGDGSANGGGHGDANANANASPQLDYTKMAEAFAQAIPRNEPQQPNTQIQLSPEEQERQWRQQTQYPTLTTDHLRPLLGDTVTSEHAAAFDKIMQLYLPHIHRVGGLMGQMMREDIDSRYAPALTLVQEREQEKFFGKVTTQYPSLKGKEQVLEFAVNQVRSQGGFPKGTPVEAGVQKIASLCESLLKGVDPNFSLANGTRTNANGAYQQPAGMLNGGGGTSSGGGGGQQKTQKSYNRLFA